MWADRERGGRGRGTRRSSRRSIEHFLPVDPAQAWRLLADTPRMVAIDPTVERYEPENGVLAAGTHNHAVIRIGPLRLRTTTLTEVLDPPNRAVFVSIEPAYPVQVTSKDQLTAVEGGCRYTVTTTVRGTTPILGALLAPVLACVLSRGRGTSALRVARELTVDG